MLNLVTDWLPEYAVFNKNIVFRMEFFTTVRDAGLAWSADAEGFEKSAGNLWEICE